MRVEPDQGHLGIWVTLRVTFFSRNCSPFLVIIDRRDSTWHSVRRALSLLNDTTSETGLALKTVLVIRPRSGFQFIVVF